MTRTTVDGVTVTTNNVPRVLVNDFELSAEERKRFDFLDWDAIEAGRDGALFLRYRGELLYLGDFLRWGAPWTGPRPAWANGWDGYSSDSFFSGLVVRFVQNGERVIVGRYVS